MTRDVIDPDDYSTVNFGKADRGSIFVYYNAGVLVAVATKSSGQLEVTAVSDRNNYSKEHHICTLDAKCSMTEVRSAVADFYGRTRNN